MIYATTERLSENISKEMCCLDQACKKPELIIKGKCKACGPFKKKRKFKKFKTFNKGYKQYSKRPFRKRWRFFKRRNKQFRGKKGTKCFICGKPGHFAKNCSQNQNGVHLISEIQNEFNLQFSDLESEFSEQEEQTDSILLARPKENRKRSIYPQALVHLLVDKYSTPIPLIAFFDTGASLSIMKKDVLPDQFWTSYEKEFTGADGNSFYTNFITKNPITLKLLPDCVITTQFLGANLDSGKDLLLGFDVYRENKFYITARGIRSKKFFKPFIEIPNLYLIEDETSISLERLKKFQQKIIKESCASNHQEFVGKF